MAHQSRRWFAPRADDLPFCCVVGSPISHSRSPEIHAAFAGQFGIQLRYERVEVGPGELGEALAEFQAIGGTGMNVTVPLKHEAWEQAGRRTPRAVAAGAANTLWYADGELNADNTDGHGLVRDLEINHGHALRDARILVLGAGGASRGVAPALLAAGPSRLMVSNRTRARAEALAESCGEPGEIEVLPWGAWPDEVPDLLINATALSLEGALPPLDGARLSGAVICYDMMYGPAGTAFTRWAAEHSAPAVHDGLGMLVEQAAESFRIWHGRTPVTAEVIAKLRLPAED